MRLGQTLVSVAWDFRGRERSGAWSVKNYEEFAKRLEGGQVLLGVKPALAKEFFTDTPTGTVYESIGEALLAERLSVKLAQLLQFVTLFLGVFAGVFALRWYNLVAVPVMVAAFFLLGRRAAGPGRRMVLPAAIVFAALGTGYFLAGEQPVLLVWVALLPLPYFFSRLTYSLATVFMRLLVMRNGKAFDLLNGKVIDVRELDQTPG